MVKRYASPSIGGARRPRYRLRSKTKTSSRPGFFGRGFLAIGSDLLVIRRDDASCDKCVVLGIVEQQDRVVRRASPVPGPAHRVEHAQRPDMLFVVANMNDVPHLHLLPERPPRRWLG